MRATSNPSLQLNAGTEPLTYRLHLVAAQILIVQAFEPFTQLFAGNAIRSIGGQLGVLQDIVLNKDRTIDAQGKRESVRGPGIDADDASLPLDPDYGVERI